MRFGSIDEEAELRRHCTGTDRCYVQTFFGEIILYKRVICLLCRLLTEVAHLKLVFKY